MKTTTTHFKSPLATELPMLKRHKNFLRSIVAELRQMFSVTNVSDGWQRGDLEELPTTTSEL